MLVLIKGAGDIASGVALRLYNSGISVIMTDIAMPTAIRRSVSFCEAIINGDTEVEGVTAVHAHSPEEALALVEKGVIPVFVDEANAGCDLICPDVLVDGVLAKKNTGTGINDAPIVIALGPGFTAGEDCHAVIETMRGHNLGRVFYDGSASPDTGIPMSVCGYTNERILRAPADGFFTGYMPIGSFVSVGETVGDVNGMPMKAQIEGVLRGIICDGVKVTAGLKCGDIDPRSEAWHCFTVSDKARSIGGGALEAILHLNSLKKDTNAHVKSTCNCPICSGERD